MRKLLFLTLFCFLLWGCTNNKRFYLEDKYYKEPKIIKIKKEELKKLEANKESFLVLVNNSSCTASLTFCQILDKVLKNNQLIIYEISFSNIKETALFDYVKFYPSIAIYKKGKIVSALDAASEEHLPYYNTVEGLTDYITKYVILK